MEHHTTIHEAGEGGVQAVCSCGWHGPVFGTDKTLQTAPFADVTPDRSSPFTLVGVAARSGERSLFAGVWRSPT